MYREARLLDERRYEDWLDVWAPEGDLLYWVPASDAVAGGDEVISYTYDNRARLATRVKQLMTGERYSQVPVSNTSRLVSNLETFADDTGGDGILALTSFALHEYRLGPSHLWAGRAEYRLTNDRTRRGAADGVEEGRAGRPVGRGAVDGVPAVSRSTERDS